MLQPINVVCRQILLAQHVLHSPECTGHQLAQQHRHKHTGTEDIAGNRACNRIHYLWRLKPARGGGSELHAIATTSERTICSDATKLVMSVAEPCKTKVRDNHMVFLGVVEDVAGVKVPVGDAVLVDKCECLMIR